MGRAEGGNAGDSVIFRTTIRRPQVRFLSALLAPVARLKRLLDALYARILEMLWEELRGSTIEYSEATNLAALLIEHRLQVLELHYPGLPAAHLGFRHLAHAQHGRIYYCGRFCREVFVFCNRGFSA